MTGLYILLIILALFALFLMIRLRVEISYIGGEFSLMIRALFFKIDGIKLLSQKQAEPEKKKKPKPEEDQERAIDKLQKLKEQLELYLYLLPPVWSRLIRRIVIQKLHIFVQVSREDAYDTALAFGGISAALNSLYGLLDSLFTLRDPVLDIRPDFVPGNAAFEAKVSLSLRIFHIFAAGLAILIRYVKHSLRKRREFKAKVV